MVTADVRRTDRTIGGRFETPFLLRGVAAILRFRPRDSWLSSSSRPAVILATYADSIRKNAFQDRKKQGCFFAKPYMDVLVGGPEKRSS